MDCLRFRRYPLGTIDNQFALLSPLISIRRLILSVKKPMKKAVLHPSLSVQSTRPYQIPSKINDDFFKIFRPTDASVSFPILPRLLIPRVGQIFKNRLPYVSSPYLREWVSQVIWHVLF